jgi:leader peptidase (prepilin peptidase)/N-methyltransferase
MQATSGIMASGLWHPLGPHGDIASNWFSPTAMLHWRYAFHIVLILALLVASFIDIDLRIIPDAVTLPAMIVGLTGGLLLGNVHLVPIWYMTPGMSMQGMLWYQFHDAIPPELFRWLNYYGVPGWIQTHPHLHGLAVSLGGIVVGGGLVWSVRIVGQWALKREAMGFGDVILLAMIGSFLGWQATLVVFFLAPLCALAVSAIVWLFWREREIPYGPYLSLAALLLIVAFKPVWFVMEQRVFSLGTWLPVVGVAMVACLAGLLALTRAVQRALGIEPVPDDILFEGWGPGDQAAYLAGEASELEQGQWKSDGWPGRWSGRGQVHDQQWRRGGGLAPTTGWQGCWQRSARNR